MKDAAVNSVTPFDYKLQALAPVECIDDELFYEQYLHNENTESPEWLLPEYKPVVRRLTQQYIEEIPIQEGVVFVKSPKGTGKTTALASLIKKHQDQGDSILLIGHRRTLLRSLSNRLGLVCYLSSEGVANITPTDAYAISVDSMSKLMRPNLHKFDVVILDEAEQVLSHLTSETLKDARDSAVRIFNHYLCAANNLYCLDRSFEF